MKLVFTLLACQVATDPGPAGSEFSTPLPPRCVSGLPCVADLATSRLLGAKQLDRIGSDLDGAGALLHVHGSPEDWEDPSSFGYDVGTGVPVPIWSLTASPLGPLGASFVASDGRIALSAGHESGVAAFLFDLPVLEDDADGAAVAIHAPARVSEGGDVLLADLDGDMDEDLAVVAWGGPDPGSLVAVDASATGVIEWADAPIRIEHARGPMNSFWGSFLAQWDLDGDGADSLVVSEARLDTPALLQVYDLPLTGTVTDADASSEVTLTAGHRGRATIGDLDFDGDDELVTSLTGDTSAGESTGQVEIWASDGTLQSRIDGAEHALLGSSFVVVDTSGDGIDDLWATAPAMASQPSAPPGRLLGFHGPLGPSLTDADADVVLGEEYSGDGLGSLATIDLDGDALGDLAVGASAHSEVAVEAGAVYLLPGTVLTP